MNRFAMAFVSGYVLIWAATATTGQAIYWAENDGSRIAMADLDGASPRELIENRVPGALQIDAAGRQLYWLDSLTIVRSSLNSSDIVELYSIPSNDKYAWVSGFAVDVANQEMYWHFHADGSQGIYKANLDGSGVNLVRSMVINNTTRFVAVDSIRQKLYWYEWVFETGLAHILRSDSDGSNVETFQDIPMGTGVQDIVVDSEGRVFWAEFLSNIGIIRRADFDGTNVITVHEGLLSPRKLFVESVGDKLYWLDYTPGSAPGCPVVVSLCHKQIRRSNLDGSNIESVRSNIVKDVRTFVVDQIDGHVIAVAATPPSNPGVVLERTNLDGTSLETLLSSRLLHPYGLRVDPESSRLLFTNATSAGIFETKIYDTAEIIRLPNVVYTPDGFALSRITGAAYITDDRGCDSATYVSRILKHDGGTTWEPVTTNVECPAGLAVDDQAGQIYWADFLQKTVNRCNLDGSATETVVTSSECPFAVEIDAFSGKIYWVDRSEGNPTFSSSRIMRSNLNGTSKTILVNLAPPAIEDFALDTLNGYIYWTTQSSIMRSRLDGSNIETIVTAVRDAHGIAVVACAPSECGGLKNRFLTYDAGRDTIVAGEPVAIRVRLVDLPQFPETNGFVYWMAPFTITNDSFNNEILLTARLQCSPNVQNWTAPGMGVGIIHLYGPEIVPRSTYEIRYATADCISLGDESCMSDPRFLRTGLWGDISAPYYSVEVPIQQPDFSDISACVNKFREINGALSRTRAKLYGNIPDPNTQVNFSDISALVDAFRGMDYSYGGPQVCP